LRTDGVGNRQIWEFGRTDITEVKSHAQFAARMILLLVRQVWIHRQSHVSLGVKREKDLVAFYLRASWTARTA
jgi:hypothetical protein